MPECVATPTQPALGLTTVVVVDQPDVEANDLICLKRGDAQLGQGDSQLDAVAA